MSRFGFYLALAACVAAHGETGFVHPGMLESTADLIRIRKAVADKAEPIWSGYQALARDPASRATYFVRGPFPTIGRNPPAHTKEFDTDANASFQCALMWAITGDRAYAAKAEQILDEWSGTLRGISGADAVLMAGLGPFKMINAAEILRSTDSHWDRVRVQQFQRMCREVIYPVLKEFAPFANGNWDSAAMKTLMAIAVFCDDRPMFERVLAYYENGWGDGSLSHYVYANGQCQESGRDQAHTQLGLAHLGDCCEIAWNQGLDLYGLQGNRLLQGFEYAARYNLGLAVPFTADIDRTGKYHHLTIATEQRGAFRPVFEQIYNHYVNRRGLSAPFTEEVAGRIRPEGAYPPGADHTGFGTLLYSRPRSTETPAAPLTAPAGLVAHGMSNEITLSWVPPIGAESYTVERRTGETGVLKEIARGIRASDYVDPDVQPGNDYFYDVVALNQDSRSSSSPSVEVYAGLPAPWNQFCLSSGIAGNAGMEDGVLRIDASGDYAVGRVLKGDGTLSIRCLPQPSSQFSSFGLELRESSAVGAKAVDLRIVSHPGRQLELPVWTVDLGTLPGASLSGVAYSRIVAPVWLRLSRKGGMISGELSSDGRTWTQCGTVSSQLPREALICVVAASGLRSILTSVRFDQLEFSSRKP